MSINLNEDCLRSICGRLDVKSQVSMALTCKFFRHVVAETYRGTSTVHITTRLWQYFDKNEKHFAIFFQCVGDSLRHLHLTELKGRRFYLLPNIVAKKLTSCTIEFRDLFPLLEDTKAKEIFLVFMSSMCDNLEQIMLNGICHEFFDLMQDLKYPNVTKCQILIKRVSFKHDFKYQADLIKDSFPKITQLVLMTDSDAKNIWELKNITELGLVNCPQIPPEFVWELYRTMRLRKFVIMPMDGFCCYEDEDNFKHIEKCQTLEELHLEYHHLRRLVNDLHKLKNLRCLTFMPKESCSCHYIQSSYLLPLARQFGHKIETLIFDTCPLDMECEVYSRFLCSMTILKRFIFVKCTPTRELLAEFATAAGEMLQEFRHIGTSDNTNVEEICEEIITKCKNLEVLDVSYSQVNLELLEKIMEMVGRNEEREKPLTIHCYDTDVKEVHLRDLIVPDLIKISTKPVTYRYSALETIQCRWEPSGPE